MSTTDAAPPPYTLPDASLPLPHTKPNPSSEPSTPLPSYTSSPTITPIQPLNTPITSVTSAHAKLSTPPTTSTPTATSTAANLLATTLIAVIGPRATDIIWLALLNYLGLLFTLAQLPLALVLAHQFNATHPLAKKGGGKGRKDKGWIRYVTQLMWDWHDELEVAELHPPSHWR